MDADGSGAIGVDELEEPFIALDLASNRDSINDLIKKVDEDGGGEIDFDEFLTIIRLALTEESSKKMRTRRTPTCTSFSGT